MSRFLFPAVPASCVLLMPCRIVEQSRQMDEIAPSWQEPTFMEQSIDQCMCGLET